MVLRLHIRMVAQVAVFVNTELESPLAVSEIRFALNADVPISERLRESDLVYEFEVGIGECLEVA